MGTIKERVQEAIYAQRDQLVGLAHDIHDHPELAFYEEYASAALVQFLAAQGFDVCKDIYGMPTAFVATIGQGPLHVAFCAEYDALPPSSIADRSKPPGLVEVWLGPEHHDAPLLHACGHNVIAAASVAAATGLKDVVDEAGLRVSVFGTPAEEMFGLPEPRDGRLAPGKILLLDAGAFDGVHAALMVHPGPTPFSFFHHTRVYPRLRARFSPASPTGRSMGVPELRKLEEALKQVILSLHQIPGLYVARPEEDGAGAQADLLWIASSVAESMPAREAVRRCFEEAAEAAGVAVEVAEYARDAELHNDPMLSGAYRKNSEALGRVRGRDAHIKAEIHEMFNSPKLPLPVRMLARVLPGVVAPSTLFMSRMPVDFMYGTDLANISQVIPAIHPYIGIGGVAGPHEAEFAVQADSAEAHTAMLDAGVAMAWTALDAATDSALRAHLLERIGMQH